MSKILIVDDDERLLKMLQRTLVYEGMEIVTASNGREALAAATTHRPDVIVLDWMMPDLDGLETLRRLRAREDRTMVLMLTARDEVENRVQGLEAGADDYLVKPFAPAELVARMHALLRRSTSAAAADALVFADLWLDSTTRRVRRGSIEIELTPTEFDLLTFFLRHPRQVLERDQILSNVWGYDFGGADNVLEVYVGYLRRKTEPGGAARLIQTVRGIGYVLRQED